MNAFQRWVGLCAWFLAAAGFAAAKEKWIYARTDHFEMYSCASERLSRQLLNDLEQFRAGFRAVFPGPSSKGARIPIVIFNHDRQFRPYQPLYDGKEKRVSGYFSYTGPSAMIAVCAERWEDASEIVYHEYVHHLVRESRRDPPLWLNEGLATAYQTTKVTRDSIELGMPNAYYLGVVRREKLMALERLIHITASSPVYNERDMANAFYANAWLLTHYLVFGSDTANAEKLLRFLALAEHSDDTEACFQEAFGKTFPQMEAALDEYASGGQCLVRIKKVAFPDLFDRIKFAPVDSVSRDVMLQKLRWLARRPRKSSPKFGDAQLDSKYRLMDIAERTPDSPKPHEVLAIIAQADGAMDEALTHWQKAAELGSDDPYVYLALAQFPLSHLVGSLNLDYRMPPAVADPIRENLERALALRPDYREAWEYLAQVEALAEKPRVAAINRVQALVQTIDKKANILAALAIARWRFNDLATCRAILESLEIENDDSFARMASWMLVDRLHQDAEEQAEFAAGSAATN